MRLSILALVPLLLGSCSSGPEPRVNQEDAINDVLISFAVQAQAGRYSDALEFLTYDEQLQIIDGNGNIKPEYKLAMNRVKLSALQKIPFELDGKGCLVGMVPVLEDANRKFSISTQQRSLNLDQVEKSRNDRAAKATADAEAAKKNAETSPTGDSQSDPTSKSTGTEPPPVDQDSSSLTIDEYLK